MRVLFAVPSHRPINSRGQETNCHPNTDKKPGAAPISRNACASHSGVTMRKTPSALAALVLAWAATCTFITGTCTCLAAESTIDYSVCASASVQLYPARITLRWPQDSCTTPQSYTVYRKSPDASTWGRGTVIPGNATEYVDNDVQPGVAYEYQIVRTAGKYNG